MTPALDVFLESLPTAGLVPGVFPGAPLKHRATDKLVNLFIYLFIEGLVIARSTAQGHLGVFH